MVVAVHINPSPAEGSPSIVGVGSGPIDLQLVQLSPAASRSGVDRLRMLDGGASALELTHRLGDGQRT